MAIQTGSVNVRITKQTHLQLSELARENGISMQAILDRAVVAYRRQCFIEGLNADFAALREKPDVWIDEGQERELWEQTLMDGLESA